MGLANKVNQIAGQVQQGIKSSSISFVSLIIKLVTALGVALTFSLVIQEMMKSGTFTFTFTMLVVGGGFLQLMKDWSLSKVLIFDLFCILLALVLRLYLQVAP